MPLLIRNQLLLAKVETTKGEDATPTPAANAILADLVDVSFDIQKIQSPEVRRSISEAPERPGRQKANFTIRAALKGSGAAGTPPEIAPLLQCCALKQTLVVTVGSEEANYKPVSAEADMKTATVHLFYDGRAVKAVGCTGNFSISAPPGEIGIITFNLQGSLTFNGDVELPTGEAYQDVTAAVVESGGFGFGSFATAVVNSFTLESGNNIIDRLDINSAGGLHSSLVVSRNPSWNAAVEATTEAVKDWWANFTDRVKEAISLTIGATAGNIVEIELPQALLNDGVTPSNNNGIVTFNLSGQALEDSGDDNYTLTFK
jgi:hypothetical protein